MIIKYRYYEESRQGRGCKEMARVHFQCERSQHIFTALPVFSNVNTNHSILIIF